MFLSLPSFIALTSPLVVKTIDAFVLPVPLSYDTDTKSLPLYSLVAVTIAGCPK